MFLTPKTFDFNIYRSVVWPGELNINLRCSIFFSQSVLLITRVMFNIYILVRQPLHEYQSTNRLNLRHLPSIPISKFGATNNLGLTANASSTNRLQTSNLFLQSLTNPSTTSNNSTIPQPKKYLTKSTRYGIDSIHSKPRQITIVKQGNDKPHKTITILLNRRTVQTYEQLLSDISESFGYQKNRTDKVRRRRRKKEKQSVSFPLTYF